MRVGILSDTHDQLDRAQRAIEMLRAEGAEALFHCGDLTGPAMVVVCTVLPCWFTFGNHDADNVPALQNAIASAGATCLPWGGEVLLADKRIALVHGHLHTDVRRLLAAEPDYLFSGHSHAARDWREGATRRINPGALFRTDELSVALLDLTSDELQLLQIDS